MCIAEHTPGRFPAAVLALDGVRFVGEGSEGAAADGAVHMHSGRVEAKFSCQGVKWREKNVERNLSAETGKKRGIVGGRIRYEKLS